MVLKGAFPGDLRAWSHTVFLGTAPPNPLGSAPIDYSRARAGSRRPCLYEALRPVKKPKGKPKLTWLSLIDKDLGGQGLNVKDTNKLKKLANNRNTWSGIIRLAQRNLMMMIV